MRARANAVFPAPRPPDKVTRSPGPTSAATSAASEAIAPSSSRARGQIVSEAVVRIVPATIAFTFLVAFRLLPASYLGRERCKSRASLFLRSNRFRRGRRATRQRNVQWKGQAQRRDGATLLYRS